MSMEKRSREEMMVRDRDMTRRALRVENQQAERLWSCLSAMETALAAANMETTAAEAAAG
jgi:hypothetical protein